MVEPNEASIEAGARALWERDARRAGKADVIDRCWPRVRSEYRAAAKVCLLAADRDEA